MSRPTKKSRAVAGAHDELPDGGGRDRLSDLPDGVLGHVLSFLPLPDAVRSSELSRRWRGAWTHATALNLSDGQLQDRFLCFAGAALARYGGTGGSIPALNVTIGCRSNLGPATVAWLHDAMERVAGSIRVSVTAPGPLHLRTLPRRMKARSISLRLSGIVFYSGDLDLQETGGSAALGGLTELSLSAVHLPEGVRPFGEFLSSCCPRLRKLRLDRVSYGKGPWLWPLVLHMDLLEELELESIERCGELQVASANLRVLVVRFCFGSSVHRGKNHVVQISAPRLEAITWSDGDPIPAKHLSFIIDSGCRVRRLAGLRFYLAREESWSTSAMKLLAACSGVDHLSVCIDIPEHTRTSMFTQENLEYVPQLPNIGFLSVRVVAVLRFMRCTVAPSIFSFLRRCPNLTRLHIDLSMLHQSSRLNPELLMVPKDDDEPKVAELQQISDHGLCKLQGNQLELDALQEIRINGFMGTEHEMEVAELLFGVGATRPALERISVSFPQLRQCMNRSLPSEVGATRSAFKMASVSFPRLWRHMDGISAKMRAQFPLADGCWETNPRKGLTWTRT
ncbi:hypothetical protein ACP70R_004495 [Stipagrostis hirtigluma subsp. patula]